MRHEDPRRIGERHPNAKTFVPTKKQIEKYLEDSSVCPACGKRSVETDRPETPDDDVVMALANCTTCGATWGDVYRLVSIQEA